MRSDSPAARGAMLSALIRPEAGADLPRPPDQLLTSSFDGFIATGLPAPLAVFVSDDGSTVAVGANESHTTGDVFAAFDRETRTLIRRVDLPERFDIARMSPDGSWALLWNERVAVRLTIADGALNTLVETDGRDILGASLSHDGALVSVAWEGGELAVYDARTGESVDVGDTPRVIEGFANFIDDATISIAVADDVVGDDVDVHVVSWDVVLREAGRSVPLQTPPVGFPPNGTYTLSPERTYTVLTFPGGTGTNMYVWDLSTGRLVGDESRRPTQLRGPAAFVTPDIIALGHFNGSLTFYDVRLDKVVERRPLAHAGGVWGIAATPDGRAMVSAADDGSVAVWGPSDRGLLDEVVMGGRAPAVSADGNRIGVITNVGGVHFVAPEGNHALTLLPGSEQIPGDTRVLQLPGDGSRALMVVANLQSQAVVVVDTIDGNLIWRTPKNVEPTGITGAALSVDGAMVYVVWNEGESLTAWNIASGASVSMDVDLTRYDTFTEYPCPSWDGKYLYLPTPNEILRLDARTLEVVSRVAHDDVLQGNLVSVPGTDQVVSVGRQGRIVRADMATGEIVRSLSRDSSSLGGLAVSVDGSTVAALHPFDGTVALFDLATLEPIGLPIPTYATNQAGPNFLADGSLLVESPGNVSRWELDVEQWQVLACDAAGRNLTVEEWQLYLGDEPYRATCPQWPAGT